MHHLHLKRNCVALRVRAWIEITIVLISSAPILVALRVRAWIEMIDELSECILFKVALRVRAWIEMYRVV